ncbi:putative MFS family arabinose efflux permease [Herbaspirillum seropedicae]
MSQQYKTEASHNVDSGKTLGLLGFLMMIGVGTLQMQPVLGGALVDHWGLNLQQMGMLFGAELIAMAIGCGTSALVVNHWDRRRLCQGGLLLLAGGSALSALHGTYWLLCASRALAGFGGGVAQTVVYATSAQRRNKDRTYAATNIMLLLWGAVSIGAAPLLISAAGVGAVFLSFPLMALPALAMTRLIPRQPGEARSAQPMVAPPLNLRTTLLLLLFGLLFAGHGVLWVYQERIGVSIGLSGPVIGAILGLSTLAGAAGAAIAGMLGKRLGHMSAQVIGFTGSIAASLAIVHGQTQLVYAASAALIMAVWFFGLTYLFALSAEFDLTGRLTSLANAAVFVGQGVGPVMAAMIVSGNNFRMVGWLAASIYAISLIIALYVTADITLSTPRSPSNFERELT